MCLIYCYLIPEKDKDVLTAGGQIAIHSGNALSNCNSKNIKDYSWKSSISLIRDTNGPEHKAGMFLSEGPFIYISIFECTNYSVLTLVTLWLDKKNISILMSLCYLHWCLIGNWFNNLTISIKNVLQSDNNTCSTTCTFYRHTQKICLQKLAV